MQEDGRLGQGPAREEAAGNLAVPVGVTAFPEQPHPHEGVHEDGETAGIRGKTAGKPGGVGGTVGK